MKKTAIIPIIVGLVCFSVNSALAQFNNFGEVIQAGVDDAEVLTRAYLAPLPSGFGSGINSGWINTAETHQPFGFDIQIRTALSFVPTSDETFDLANLDLQKTRAADPDQTISPTIGGNNEIGPVVVIEDDGNEVARFNLPKGSGYPVVPSAMIQAGVGLVADTDLIIRYIPQFSYENTTFNMYGVGLKHGINQWIPGGKLLPVNISIMGGFTRIDVQSALNLQPEGLPADPIEDAGKSFDEQFANISLNAFTVKALVGKSLPFISFYGGLGYQTSMMEVDVVGNYPVNVSTPFGDRYEVITDPFTYDAEGDNKFSLLGGATLKMAFFRLFGEFTLAEYSTASVGIGFSFR
ncbi:MAG TPA: DUF6588 family protein [Balneolaceae bacterium]